MATARHPARFSFFPSTQPLRRTVHVSASTRVAAPWRTMPPRPIPYKIKIQVKSWPKLAKTIFHPPETLRVQTFSFEFKFGKKKWLCNCKGHVKAMLNPYGDEFGNFTNLKNWQVERKSERESGGKRGQVIWWPLVLSCVSRTAVCEKKKTGSECPKWNSAGEKAIGYWLLPIVAL